MAPRSHKLFNGAALLALVVAVVLLVHLNDRPEVIATNISQDSGPDLAETSVDKTLSSSPSNGAQNATSTAQISSASLRSAPVTPADQGSKAQQAAVAGSLSPTPSSAAVQQVARVIDPYNGAPPLSASTDYALTYAALVNILCQTSGQIHPISGSGVIIDPRGVILTNAHVAQYVLLSEASGSNLDCAVRTGSPARAAWKAAVLYLPPAWVSVHAKQINTPDPTGTGAHDYALLLITGTADGAPLPADNFPFLPFDTRQAVGFPEDIVLVAGYPAEFLGAVAAENALYPEISNTAIQNLLTFGNGSVDLLSLHGAIEAQSGSSGGAIVNAWGRLVGLIVTTTSGANTTERDLHALTLSYIAKDFAVQSGSSLADFLSGDLTAKLDDFNTNTAPSLLQKYVDVIKSQQ